MTRQQLVQHIKNKRSYLCVGLDTDITKIPKHLLTEPDPVFEFNKAIIDATRDLCVSYKLNTAFYEALGLKGWESLEKTAHYIGNTSDQYAKAFFETLPFDAVTVAPYMGKDSVEPFLRYAGKWAIVLGLTSNSGAVDFELESTFIRGYAYGNDSGDAYLKSSNPVEMLFEKVLRKVSEWGDVNNLMFVIGATNALHFEEIRKIAPDHFYLVPGVGAQGGSLKDISEKAMIKDGGIIVNASRAIIYASDKENFATEARLMAKQYQVEMASYLPF